MEAILIDPLKRLSYHIRDSKNRGDVAFHSVLSLLNGIVGKTIGVDWQVDDEPRHCALVLDELGLFGSSGFSLVSRPLECFAPRRIASDIKSKRPLISEQGLDVADDNVLIAPARRNQFLLRIALGQLKTCKPITVGGLDKTRYFSLGNACIPRQRLDSGMIGDVSRHKRAKTAKTHCG